MTDRELLLYIRNSVDRIASELESEKRTRAEVTKMLSSAISQAIVGIQAVQLSITKATWFFGSIIAFLNLIVTVVTVISYLKK